MNAETISEKLRTIMSDVLGVEPDAISEQSTNESIPNWDSVHAISLLLSIEEEFQVTFSDSEATKMSSFAEIKKLLEAKALSA